MDAPRLEMRFNIVNVGVFATLLMMFISAIGVYYDMEANLGRGTAAMERLTENMERERTERRDAIIGLQAQFAEIAAQQNVSQANLNSKMATLEATQNAQSQSINRMERLLDRFFAHPGNQNRGGPR